MLDKAIHGLKMLPRVRLEETGDGACEGWRCVEVAEGGYFVRASDLDDLIAKLERLEKKHG